MTMLSTHVLDTGTGRPASGVPVRLLRGDETLAQGVTDADGRVGDLGEVAHGGYRLEFDTSAYSDFFPRVEIAFVISDDRHHHVPLLLGTFAYSTYRGS